MGPGRLVCGPCVAAIATWYLSGQAQLLTDADLCVSVPGPLLLCWIGSHCAELRVCLSVLPLSAPLAAPAAMHPNVHE